MRDVIYNGGISFSQIPASFLYNISIFISTIKVEHNKIVYSP